MSNVWKHEAWTRQSPYGDDGDFDEDFRIVCCEACGSEGFRSYTATVYEPGCGYGHDEVLLDYSRPCKVCEGKGREIIPVEPITLDDLMEAQ